MKTLIIGAKGMLGHDLMETFADHDLTGWDRDDIDITNLDQTALKIKTLKPDLIINAAAYTNVDKCEEDRESCFKVNATSVKNLAQIARDLDAILVHYSTDYVFSGTKKEGYQENDNDFKPQNVYGESKLQGEKELLSNCERYYLIRTSWLYGKNGKNFVDTIIMLSQKNPELKVVNDQHGKPTFSKDLARATKELVNSQAEFGIYHLVNEPETAWADFAQEIFKQKNIKVKVTPCTSGEFPRPAQRPAYSSLINTKFKQLRPWPEALKEYLSS